MTTRTIEIPEGWELTRIELERAGARGRYRVAEGTYVDNDGSTKVWCDARVFTTPENDNEGLGEYWGHCDSIAEGLGLCERDIAGNGVPALAGPANVDANGAEVGP
jgi:hypothetical protein